MVSPKATFDELASASAIFSGLQVADKDVKLLAPSTLKQSFGISKLDELKTEIGYQNLLISFDYNEEAVDQVGYHIGEGTNKFYLTIKPKKGHEPLDSDTIEFSYTGAETDLIITVGVEDLEELEQLYFGYEKLFQDAPVISIYEYPTEFGTVRYDVSENTCYAELVTQLMSSAELHIGSEEATHLLSSIEQQSRGFKSTKTTADTFDVVASLLRLGATRTQERQLQPSIPEGRIDTLAKKDSTRVQDSEEKSFDIKRGQDTSVKHQGAPVKQTGGNPRNRGYFKSKHQRSRQRADQQSTDDQRLAGNLNYQPQRGEGGTSS